jgi:hypothetical protein
MMERAQRIRELVTRKRNIVDKGCQLPIDDRTLKSVVPLWKRGKIARLKSHVKYL